MGSHNVPYTCGTIDATKDLVSDLYEIIRTIPAENDDVCVDVDEAKRIKREAHENLEQLRSWNSELRDAADTYDSEEINDLNSRIDKLETTIENRDDEIKTFEEENDKLLNQISIDDLQIYNLKKEVDRLENLFLVRIYRGVAFVVKAIKLGYRAISRYEYPELIINRRIQ